MIADQNELLDAALGVLRERGPLSDRELAAALTNSGWGGVDDLIDHVEEFDAPLLGTLPDDRRVALDVLLAGRVLTHRLTAEEIAADVVEPDDFGSLLHFASGDPEVDGFEVVFFEDEADELAARGGVGARCAWTSSASRSRTPPTWRCGSLVG